MWQPAAVFLLEAYASPGWPAAPVEELRAEIESRDGLRVIGMVVVPVDEAVLCLVAVESAASESAMRKIAERYGAAARLLEVSWAPVAP